MPLYRTVTTNRKDGWSTRELHIYMPEPDLNAFIDELYRDGFVGDALYYERHHRNDPWIFVSSANLPYKASPRPDHRNVTHYVTRGNTCYYYRT